MKCKLLIFVVFVVFLKPAFAQESVSVSYNYGRIAKHSSEIAYIYTNPVRGFAIEYAMPNSKGTSWRKLYNFPDYGLSYNFKNYGNPEQIGNSHSITGFFQMPFLRKTSVLNFGFKTYTGFGFITKKYDPVTNPLNNAISTAINISIEGRAYAKIRIKPLFFEYSWGLMHFSNGLVKAPNLGINVINNRFSLGYELEDNLPYEKSRTIKTPKVENHEFWSLASLGLKQNDPGSKKYTPSSISLNYSKHLTKINKIGFGIDFIHDPSLTTLARQRYFYTGESNLNFRYGVNAHNEFLFGNTGLYMAYGFYPGNSDYYTSVRYYKVGFKYYFKNIFGGVIIRAIPLFRADVLEFGIGYKLSRRKSEK